MSHVFKFADGWYYQATDLPCGYVCFPQAPSEPYVSVKHATEQGPIDATCYLVELETVAHYADLKAYAERAVAEYRHERGLDRLADDLGMAE